MTTNQMPVQRCQYCGSDDLGLGWQHGEGNRHFQEARTPGQPVALPDLPPLWCCGVSVGGGASQVPTHQVSPPEIAPQIKDNLWR